MVIPAKLETLNPNPGGSVPEERLQLNGDDPAVTLITELYAAPTVLSGSVVVAIVGRAVMNKVALATCEGSDIEVATTVAAGLAEDGAV